MVADLTRPGSSVLDLCTGSGIVAVSAARAGAGQVVAVDVTRRAVLTARWNGVLNGERVQGRRGDLYTAVGDQRFDLIASNPPYLPSEADDPVQGPARAWEGGVDGRAFVDRLIAGAPAHLRPGGSLVVLHSSLCGWEATEEHMRAAGLKPEVLVRQRGPLGPLLTARARLLEARGLLAPGEREEDILVFRATAPGA